jgi:methylated-DNA-[protein]-cysteine S-methyltransferase
MFAKPPEHLAISRLETPIGVALLAIDEGGYLRAFDWEDYGNRQVKLLARFNGGALSITEGTAPAAIRQAVAAYFDGDLNALSTIPWRTGGTEFQLKCWKALCEIPAGSTASYAEQAVKIGKPTAMRAVGLANGCNPVGVIVPCHRVIGANGSITGYGGGLWRKRWLLQHEGATFYDRRAAFSRSSLRTRRTSLCTGDLV